MRNTGTHRGFGGGAGTKGFARIPKRFSRLSLQQPILVLESNAVEGTTQHDTRRNAKGLWGQGDKRNHEKKKLSESLQKPLATDDNSAMMRE